MSVKDATTYPALLEKIALVREQVEAMDFIPLLLPKEGDENLVLLEGGESSDRISDRLASLLDETRDLFESGYFKEILAGSLDAIFDMFCKSLEPV